MVKSLSGSDGLGGSSSSSASASDVARLHLMGARLVKLAARLRTGRPGALGAARQLALARAAADLNAVTRVALPGDAGAFPPLPPPQDGAFWVRACLLCAAHLTSAAL